MKPNATLWDRFEGWFWKPIEKLRECPEGDGAFIAMSASLALCERYYRTVTNTHEGQKDLLSYKRSGAKNTDDEVWKPERQRDDISFRRAAAKDLGIEDWKFEIFWQVFRHGIQHQGMPKRYEDRNKVTYRWQIAAGFPSLPDFHVVNLHLQVIRIDPWAFAEIICKKYRANPAILHNATVHAFGEVSS
jgi:hypothetical protein